VIAKLMLALALLPAVAAAAEPGKASGSATVAAAGGSISGLISSPGEYIPALRVYAIGVDGKTHRMITTEQNQAKFTIDDVPPGKYHVVGYPSWREGLPAKAVGWTRASQCVKGPCDHNPLPVTVAAGKPSDGILLADWYAPAGRLPAEPVAREEVPPQGDCEKLGSQSESDACHLHAYEREDKDLNIQYEKLNKAMAPHPACRDELQKAERAWLKFREQHCAFEGAIGDKGRITRCLRELTIARTAYLQRQHPEDCRK
jgi:uncharacterized protein YecT (DUF1311 family)